jgi:hypothetical protein
MIYYTLVTIQTHLREGVKHEGNFERHSDPLPEVVTAKV